MSRSARVWILLVALAAARVVSAAPTGPVDPGSGPETLALADDLEATLFAPGPRGR